MMPLPSVVSCFIKIEFGSTFWCWLAQVVLEKRPLKGCLSEEFFQVVQKAIYTEIGKFYNTCVISVPDSDVFAQKLFRPFTLQLHLICPPLVRFVAEFVV